MIDVGVHAAAHMSDGKHYTNIVCEKLFPQVRDLREMVCVPMPPKRCVTYLHCSKIGQASLLEVLVRADDQGVGVDAHARSEAVEGFHVGRLQLLSSVDFSCCREASKRENRSGIKRNIPDIEWEQESSLNRRTRGTRVAVLIDHAYLCFVQGSTWKTVAAYPGLRLRREPSRKKRPKDEARSLMMLKNILKEACMTRNRNARLDQSNLCRKIA